ncbi:MAG: hypothetical protein L0H39_09550 [Brachybacterium sp.]|nr:hypothetical protein [Brachybacterium sp.]
MPYGTSLAQKSLARALATTTTHRRLMMPEDLADHLLAPDDEVLIALPSIPDNKPRIVMVTREEVILGQWSAAGYSPKDITQKRAIPGRDVRGASYSPGLYHDVEIKVRSARDLSIQPCTVEDGIRFAHALQALATTGQVPPPMPPADVVTARHAQGNYSPDSVESRMCAAWDRAVLATTALWNCEEVHSGPALGWLYPGEQALLVLLGQTGVSTEYLAVTDRRVLRGSAPGARVKERPAADVRDAVFDEGRFKDAVRIEMHDGSSLKLDGGIHPLEGREFVDALNALIATGSLPTELLPFR